MVDKYDLEEVNKMLGDVICKLNAIGGTRTRVIEFNAISPDMEEEIIKGFEKVINKYIAEMVVLK